MITFIIAVGAGGGAFAAAYYAADFGLGWSIFCALAGFGVFQAIAGIAIQKRVKAEMEKVQAILVAGQQKLQEKMNRWQMRPPGSIQAAQKELADNTRVFVKDAIVQADSLNKFKLWVPMMDRQIATAKLQLNWMIKDFKKVDALMPKALMIDPMMVAIKMSRMYMTGADMKAIEKVYLKGVARTRYNQNVLLAAAWSWMQVQKGNIDGAFKCLTDALKKSDNETLRRNHELLMNNKVAHFSNSGLGDQWYSLLLEELKVKMQRQRSVYR